ncbi:glucose-1-phosphatase [Edwardsiella piscicida]|uniref:Glucose-1-phosphatase n=3 Tax=Edwardsiella TaxID=635 RepID=A0AAQ3C273_EDWPI|nr:glucose-1-phosphatase [Edwardsiella piscicida]ACY86322.1 phosphatase [Edwardsiella tarda EIB202]ADM43256.1 probable haloacid dehalogenase-like hydrolase [Edwardsiella tarda FL6-60]AGH75477.1 alpha-D-glucose-1-phosphatase [Edwardsiella piscicida C07-087]AOP44630.1 glucose-1-phosphatase [Edwardsiella piscicida]ARD18337.1 glucose-1-phosphatase [Edwardsiella piscicida]
MLYIFDLGNVIVDIDFHRVLGVWSRYSGAPLATLSKRFTMGDTFRQHERGAIDDETFAQRLCDEMGISLSFAQFELGWQAIFVALRPEVIDIMQRLRRQGERVVVLSNTNRLHTHFWPKHYPEIAAACDKMYLSQELGMRKPDAEIYRYVLEQERAAAGESVFFDDNADNVAAAKALGIQAVQVCDRQVIPAYFA